MLQLRAEQVSWSLGLWVECLGSCLQQIEVCEVVLPAPHEEALLFCDVPTGGSDDRSRADRSRADFGLCITSGLLEVALSNDLRSESLLETVELALDICLDLGRLFSRSRGGRCLDVDLARLFRNRFEKSSASCQISDIGECVLVEAFEPIRVEVSESEYSFLGDGGIQI